MKNKTIGLTAAFFVIFCVSVFAGGEQEVSVTIPGSVHIIEGEEFQRRGLTNVIIENGVRIIGDYVFAGNRLTNINLPDSVHSIGGGAFAVNPLTRVTIPRNVIKMVDLGSGENANPFPIASLEYISVDPANSYFVSVDGVLYSKDRKILFAYPSAKGKVYTIPDGVIEIASRAFAGTPTASQIERISLPNGLVTIGGSAFMCASLTSVIIPDSVKEIGSHAFYENNLTSVTISTNITSIEIWTFYGNRLTSVIIPSNVTSIGSMAFCNNKLTSITIGANVTMGNIYHDGGGYTINNGFDNDFDDFYNLNGKRAGTYTYTNGRWNRR